MERDAKKCQHLIAIISHKSILPFEWKILWKMEIHAIYYDGEKKLKPNIYKQFFLGQNAHWDSTENEFSAQHAESKNETKWKIAFSAENRRQYRIFAFEVLASYVFVRIK